MEASEWNSAPFPQRWPGRCTYLVSGNIAAAHGERAITACPGAQACAHPCPAGRRPFGGRTSTLLLVHVGRKRGRPISTQPRRKENVPGVFRAKIHPSPEWRGAPRGCVSQSCQRSRSRSKKSVHCARGPAPEVAGAPSPQKPRHPHTWPHALPTSVRVNAPAWCTCWGTRPARPLESGLLRHPRRLVPQMNQ